MKKIFLLAIALSATVVMVADNTPPVEKADFEMSIVDDFQIEAGLSFDVTLDQLVDNDYDYSAILVRGIEMPVAPIFENESNFGHTYLEQEGRSQIVPINCSFCSFRPLLC